MGKNMVKISAIIATVLFGGAIGQGQSLGATFEPAPSNDDKLLDFLMLRNEAAMGRISTLTAQMDWTIDMPGHPTSTSGNINSAKLAWRGDSFWAEMKTKVEFKDGQPPQQLMYRSVRNSRFTAFWPNVPQLYAYQYDNPAPGVQDIDAAKFKKLSEPPDVFLWGFGNGSETLRIARNQHQDINRWEVERTSGSGRAELFIVKMFTPAVKVANQPMVVMTIDPSQGYLITRVLAYKDNGQLGSETNISVGQVGPDHVWFPLSYSEVDYLRSTNGEKAVLSREEYRLSDVRINEPIPDSQFELSALGMPKTGVRIIRKDATGDSKVFDFVDGALIPRDINRLRAEALSDLSNLETLGNTATRVEQTQPATAPTPAHVTKLPVIVLQSQDLAHQRTVLYLVVLGLALAAGMFAWYLRFRLRHHS